MSHAYNDSEVILGLCYFIEGLGYSVYLDWKDDPQLNRSKVTPQTANTLRIRMKQSKCLLFATSENSSSSIWMPWELGFFDALKGRVGVIPLASKINSPDTFEGQEYLGLYNYVVKTGQSLYVHSSASSSVTFSQWLNQKISPG
ncbi:hypothetical protein A7975_23755 [Bacillus sp. FJAT-26390]|nr:hypothetical protein A7975_23755 [Bacillus sp. FJAT-26390]